MQFQQWLKRERKKKILRFGAQDGDSWMGTVLVYKALELMPAPHKPGVVKYAYKPREAEAGGSEVKGHSQLYIEFKASL